MAKRSSNLKGLLFFGIFWMAIVGAFDGVIGFNMYRQMRAEDFPSVTGRIVASEVTRHRSKNGYTHRPDITFAYEVGGRTYTSDTNRFGNFSTSNGDRASRIVRMYPEGREVEVFYDPADPAQAVLETGVQEIDGMFLLFLTPFNIVGIGVWLLLAQTLHRRLTKPIAGGAPVVQRGQRTHIRLPRVTPLYAAGATALGISFVAMFILAFGFGFDPSFATLNATWGLIAVASAAVYFHRRFVIGSGTKDLVIDDETGTLSLPQTFGRRQDIIMSRDSVADIEVEVIEHRGNKGRISYSYAPTLIWSDESGAARREKLADWRDERRARDFAGWLRDRLGAVPETIVAAA